MTSKLLFSLVQHILHILVGGTKTKTKNAVDSIVATYQELRSLLFCRLFEVDPLFLSNHIFTYFAYYASCLTKAGSFSLILLVSLFIECAFLGLKMFKILENTRPGDV